MNIIILAARQSQLLAKAEIDQIGLESLERDMLRQFSIKADACYLTYDDQGGITITIVLTKLAERKN